MNSPLALDLRASEAGKNPVLFSGARPKDGSSVVLAFELTGQRICLGGQAAEQLQSRLRKIIRALSILCCVCRTFQVLQTLQPDRGKAGKVMGTD
jgi:hypothetical protein